jgi:capsular polysaccharide biosynthesis protein
VHRLSSPLVATTPAPTKGFDPEAEQDVDFARYGRMLARRWWLVAIGVVAGAVIGYLVSLGGTKVYSATATLYLGQPYNGTTPIINIQTNPSTVSQIANSEAVDAKAANQCKTTVQSFRKGISVQRVATSTPAKGLASQVSPLVTLTVQAPKGKATACVANALARAAVAGISEYPKAQIALYNKHVAADNAAINSINAAIADPSVTGTDKAVLQQSLRSDQADLSTYSQLLLLAKTVEMPKVTVLARERQVTAQSSRNTVLIAALIGLILGVIGALLWDRIMPRVSARNGS